MGKSVFHVEGLGGVLDRVTARVMSIPRGRRLMVNNTLPKIVILLEGPVRALVDGAVIGDLQAGDALVVPGPCKQSYLPLVPRRETRMHALVVVFRGGVFAGGGGAEAADAGAGFVRRHFGRVQLRRGVLTPAAAAAIEALRREAAEKGVGHRLRATAHGLLLLTEIARSEGEPPPAAGAEPPDRSAWRVEQVQNFLLEHHAGELTLDQVAWHMRLSAEHLARSFRKATGRTVFDYLRHLRVEHAKTLLAGSRLSVTEVARACGFSSATLLVRNFRRVAGETPLGYRRRAARDATYSPSTFLAPEL